MTIQRKTIALAQFFLLVGLMFPCVTFAQNGKVDPVSPEPQKPASQPASDFPATAKPAAQPTTDPAKPGTDPAKPADAPAAQPAPAAAPASDGSAFISLTQLPGLSSTGTSPSLPAFFNSLYKLCIGAAAVIAVLQIMRAGVEYMRSSGSVSGNEAAKSLIQNSILGLVLVLSPYIVFSIINPNILKLELDLGPLKSSITPTGVPTATVAGQFTGADSVLWESVNGNVANDTNRCKASSGTLAFQCAKKTDANAARAVSATDTCSADENKYNVCKAGSSTVPPATGDQCTDKYSVTKSFPIDNGSPAGTQCAAPSVAVPHGCCKGANATGNICCGVPK